MDHKELEAWKQTIELIEKIYRLSKQFPKEELYGITLQIRRAAVSIASNISEGAARNSKKEFLNFLNYSLGSLAEVETQLIIASRLQYYTDSLDVFIDINRIRALILGVRNYLRRKGERGDVKGEG